MINVLLCIGMEHNIWLVGVAAFVCVTSTLATFYLYSRVPSPSSWRKMGWLTMTGLVAGADIWTTHFVAMLAFKSGLPTGYAVLPTTASLGVAVFSTTCGFAIASSRIGRGSSLTTVGGGLVVGLGITLMHYVGMLGYRTAGVVQWDTAYVTASVAVGGLLASAALLVAHSRSGVASRVGSAGLLTLAIVGMHFTGMTAVTVVPDSSVRVPATLMSTAVMVAASVVVTALILIVATGGVALDAARRTGNLRRLREALDAMPEGLAFYDASDRLTAWNAQYDDLCRSNGAELKVGLEFASLLESSVLHGAYPAACGREAAWVAERQAARWGAAPSVVLQTASGRWLRVNERRTADGGTVSVSVDITDLKRAEAAMAEARDQAEELARRAEAAEAVAGFGHWRVDAGTHELTWSAQIYRIYGLDADQALDLERVMAMTHPDDALVASVRLEEQLARGGADENSLTRIVRADGEVRYLLCNSDTERGSNGEVLAVIGTALDVTAQKMADIAIRTSEERFRSLAVNAPDMITEFQLDGIMTYVSPASLAITGYTPDELVGQHFTTLMEPEDGEKVLAMCQTVFRSKGKIAAWPVEFRARHKAGHELWLECKPTLTADPITGKFNCLNDVVRDITPRKALEARLRLAQVEAEEAASVKADFLANMSHELRTPLTSIIGFTGLAAEQADLADLTRDYIDRVGNASRALLCTVNDILDFSKLEAGQVAIHPEAVSVSKLCRDTLDLFTPQAGAKDLGLSLDGGASGDDLVLLIDPDRLRQILLNLVSNAVKFTTVGGVALRTRYDDDTGNLRVEVADTGEGISQDKQERLFKRFSQIDGSLTRTQSGTGLGLAICKGLVEAMGGHIGIESQAGEGSCFWFEIPSQRAVLAETPKVSEASDQISFTGVRVLVVDDHAANRDLARLFLTGVGAEITEAADGESAAQMASEAPYDVILMDVQMPGLDGPGALRKIRAAPGPNDMTPILAFTADADPAALSKLISLGFEDVVGKPVEPQALIAAVGRATAFAEQIRKSSDAA
ncbi:MAG: PAS domain S-box protein [Phenylobacterium sp.]|uniref:PAS domain S-box protein n=1 Tax=Phenylobacterium sp. TaxID=1871053 RepID=UPI002735A795|nr:PAS domain S-box protein [Phenylobacterium sp.]MDP3175928.1 PAS domain S-box protein [Phenylobacterium sp.]